MRKLKKKLQRKQAQEREANNMKKFLVSALSVLIFIGIAQAQLTFYLIDNFEDGALSKWYVFDNVKAEAVNNPVKNDEDSVAESCGEKSCKISGKTDNWYAGGMGTILDVDGYQYSRFLIDVYGSKNFGKIKAELFERKTASSTEEVKWVVEIPVLGSGFTRYSIPFSAFNLDKAKEITFHGKRGGRISKLQLIFVAQSEKGDVDLAVDNLIFTF